MEHVTGENIQQVLHAQVETSAQIMTDELNLGIFGLIEAAWFIAGLLGSVDVLRGLLIPALLFGAAGAGYTAFLLLPCSYRPHNLRCWASQGYLRWRVSSPMSIVSWLPGRWFR